MKRTILFLALLLSSLGAFAQSYDFSAVAPSGQTLYYKNYTEGAVRVAPQLYQPSSNGSYYSLGNSPTGDLVIPDSVEFGGRVYVVVGIGGNSFRNCNISSVVVPNTVRYFGERSFEGCRLQSIVIPSSVKEIQGWAFQGCRNLDMINYLGTLTEWCNIFFLTGDANPVSESNSHNLIINGVPLGNTLIIPDSVTRIKAYSFDKFTNIRSIVFHDAVSYIGECAFISCSNLSDLTIPTSVIQICDRAFAYCTGLTNVIFKALNCDVSDDDDDPAFKGCTNLTSIIVDGNVQEGPAMEGCDALKTIFNYSNQSVSHITPDRIILANDTTMSSIGSNALIVVNNLIIVPQGHLPSNYMAFDGNSWKAKNIVLTDGVDAFKAPENFIAEKVTYTRSYEQGNRSTICLPFKPATVNGSSTTNLKFYEFADFDGTTITFNEVDFEDLAANTPYMVEWPALKTAQDFVFGATDATIPATGDAASRTVEHGNGKFIGTMERTHMNSTNYYGYKNGYFVQSAGGQAEDAHAHVNPFRAYFQITPSGSQGFAMPTELSVRFNTAEDNVGIDSVEPQQSNIRYSNDVYDMMGRMVRKNAKNLDGLRKGVYIWKGEKKIVF